MKRHTSIPVVVGLLSFALATANAQWVQTTSLPDGYQEHGLAYAQGFLFHTGGVSAYNAELNGTNVFYAQVLSNGTIGVWKTNTPMPEAVFDHVSVAANGYLYVLGGNHYVASDNYDGPTNVVYYAKINTNGILGSWQVAEPLPYPVIFHGAATWNNRIYIAGGSVMSAYPTNQVFSANIRSDGSLSAWVAQTPLPYAVYGQGQVANGMLYVLGGAVDGGTIITNAVYYSRINSDGSLAGWNQTARLPATVAAFAAVDARGFVFSVGGWNGSSYTKGFYYSQVAGDGSLKTWTNGLQLPISVFYHAATVSDSYIFVSGGSTPVETSRNVYSMALPAPPAAPTLVSRGFTNGNFQLQLASGTNTGFGLLASPDLINWTNIGWGFTDNGGSLLFQDTNAASFPKRFYRAYWPLP